MSYDDWWKICPVCQTCDEVEDCEEPCAFAMSFFNGNLTDKSV